MSQPVLSFRSRDCCESSGERVKGLRERSAIFGLASEGACGRRAPAWHPGGGILRVPRAAAGKLDQAVKYHVLYRWFTEEKSLSLGWVESYRAYPSEGLGQRELTLPGSSALFALQVFPKKSWKH